MTRGAERSCRRRGQLLFQRLIRLLVGANAVALTQAFDLDCYFRHGAERFEIKSETTGWIPDHSARQVTSALRSVLGSSDIRSPISELRLSKALTMRPDALPSP